MFGLQQLLLESLQTALCCCNAYAYACARAMHSGAMLQESCWSTADLLCRALQDTVPCLRHYGS